MRDPEDRETRISRFSKSQLFVVRWFDGLWLPSWFPGDELWPSGDPACLALVADVEQRCPPLEDPRTRTRVGIGVASGADAVYLTRDGSVVEEDRLLPLATAGDWMRDPRRYRRRASWLAAVRDLAGPGRAHRLLRRTLRAFAETSWSTKLDLAEAPTFVRLNGRFLHAYDTRPSQRSGGTSSQGASPKMSATAANAGSSAA